MLTRQLSIGTFITAALAAAFSAMPARAGLVVGNLTTPESVGTAGIDFPFVQMASSFALDAGFTPMDLTSITVRLQSPNTGLNAHVWLYSHGGSAPDSQLVDLGTAFIAQGSAFANYTFLAGSSFTLMPSTTYWIAIGTDTDAAPLNWRLAASGSLEPGSSLGASIPGGLAFSNTSGANWGLATNDRGMFSVEGTVIPAPGALAALGIGAIVGTRRRRRRA